MRRLLALVPAALLVLAVAIPAQAGDAVKTGTCKGSDGSTTGATVSVTWDDSGTVNSFNRPINASAQDHPHEHMQLRVGQV